jgi:hypothetical protein
MRWFLIQLHKTGGMIICMIFITSTSLELEGSSGIN